MTLTVGQVLTIAILFAIAGICFRFGSALVNKALRRAYSKKQWADRFFTHSKPLLDDVDTPLETLETLAFLNLWINDRSGAKSLFQIRGSVMADNTKSRALADAEGAFFDRRPELLGPYLAAMTSALLAASFMRAGFDELFRARLIDIYGSVEATLEEDRKDSLRTEIAGALREISNGRATFRLAPA